MSLANLKLNIHFFLLCIINLWCLNSVVALQIDVRFIDRNMKAIIKFMFQTKRYKHFCIKK